MDKVQSVDFVVCYIKDSHKDFAYFNRMMDAIKFAQNTPSTMWARIIVANSEGVLYAGDIDYER